MAEQRIQGPRCQKCGKDFVQKSSLSRHLKRCLTGDQAPPRRKACEECSNAKTRCDLERPCCGRCASKGNACNYPADGAGRHRTPPTAGLSPASSTSCKDSETYYETSEVYMLNTGIDGKAEAITSQTFLKEALAVSKHVANLVIRVLKSYPRLVSVRKPVPFIHFSQFLLHPLFTSPAYRVGQDYSSDFQPAFTHETNEKSLHTMRTIIQQYNTFDEVQLLEAVQVYLIHAILVLFPNDNSTLSHQIEQEIILGLHDITLQLALSGLLLAEECATQVPSWRDWIIASSKRRTVLVSYMASWAWSVKHEYSQFSCISYGFMPSPAAKNLWEAQTPDDWEINYKDWLLRWTDKPHRVGELMWIEPGSDLPRRTEMWLEEADEFGVLLMSTGMELEPISQYIY